jgi:transcriptional regulator with XRE-family HTH domain
MGNRVHELMELAGLTVEQLAGLAGMTSHTLRRIEAGEQELSDKALNKLAEALSVTPTDLLEEPQFHVEPQERGRAMTEIEKIREAYAEVRREHPTLPRYENLSIEGRDALIAAFFAGVRHVREPMN